MSRNEKILNLAKVWARQITPSEATRRLYGKKMGFSTADQISRGIYKRVASERTLSTLLREMAKDGFSLTDEKAS